MSATQQALTIWHPGDPLELHPAWRNPDAAAEDAEALQKRCPHPETRYFCGDYFDPTSPSLERFWIGCCDCGLIVTRDNWRLRQATKAEIKKDRARVLADLDPFTRELVATKYPLES